MGKLVRDRIDEIIYKSGKTPVIRILDDEEYLVELKKKLQEEVDEFLADNNLAELADITEVVHALAVAIGKSTMELYNARIAKSIIRGKFEDKKYLVEVLDNDK